MTKPTIKIHNTETNEVIDREMTSAEFAIYQAEQKIQAQRESQIQAKAEAKIAAQAKLAALGLTVEDLTALGL